MTRNQNLDIRFIFVFNILHWYPHVRVSKPHDLLYLSLMWIFIYQATENPPHAFPHQNVHWSFGILCVRDGRYMSSFNSWCFVVIINFLLCYLSAFWNILLIYFIWPYFFFMNAYAFYCYKSFRLNSIISFLWTKSIRKERIHHLCRNIYASEPVFLYKSMLFFFFFF